MKHRLQINPLVAEPATRDHDRVHAPPESLPPASATKLHPTNAGGENARLFFVGTATTILEWEGIRLMTDPNFLHAGDHVHLGPGVTATRQTNPAVDLHALPRIDLVLLSHYHADHFDQHVEASLRRDLPIITTPHAREHLAVKKPAADAFTQVYDLDFFESAVVDVVKPPPDVDDQGKPTTARREPAIKVTGMPGKHVPPGPLSVANELLGAVPPTNGWMLELGYRTSSPAENDGFECGYRVYISGDTLNVPELREIPQRYTDAGYPVDLMLVHLGGTTIPGPSMPLLMVTMDAKQGVDLIRLVRPDVTIPIHYDDYDVFLSPLEDFKKAVEEAGLNDKVVYLDRKDEYNFRVQ
ncbi:uncharacterized protein K452DRAFT_271115 [Aplosporella prunicola CBS 121167]|uniref:Metallo-beta-lactamase domain-containing protein n=1 Tax=Aplosporella prunicola CBS 121167 TaxID=1176127 RepID=A0A6A6BDJ1_9PEZI|nr:uncharacterized protein K452DRAFT_271115 [Aplosporella prunicola CBS 121167]KAF2142252.1 hypothetical protein K452DRAFT_271115 [Aplosporella prunicola CBS 121167]